MWQAEAAARNAAWHQHQRNAASLQQQHQRNAASLQQQQGRLRERRQQQVMQQAQQKQLERVHKHQQREERSEKAIAACSSRTVPLWTHSAPAIDIARLLCAPPHAAPRGPARIPCTARGAPCESRARDLTPPLSTSGAGRGGGGGGGGGGVVGGRLRPARYRARFAAAATGLGAPRALTTCYLTTTSYHYCLLHLPIYLLPLGRTSYHCLTSPEHNTSSACSS